MVARNSEETMGKTKQKKIIKGKKEILRLRYNKILVQASHSLYLEVYIFYH